MLVLCQDYSSGARSESYSAQLVVHPAMSGYEVTCIFLLLQVQCGRDRSLQPACPVSTPLSVSDGVWQGGCDGFLRWMEAYAAKLTAGGIALPLCTCSLAALQREHWAWLRHMT